MAPAILAGCTDPSAFNFNSSADYDDGSCIAAVVLGCLDSEALNFDSSANTGDGSCYYVLGCTDITAFNFSPSADFDDGLVLLLFLDVQIAKHLILIVQLIP